MKHILIILSFLLIPPLFDSLNMLHGREMTVLDSEVLETQQMFEELKTLKNQVWMSGSDKSLFSDIIKEKEVVNLEIEDLLKQ